MGNRLWVLGTVVLCIALVALGWLLGVSPRLDEISAAREQRATVDQQNEIARARIVQLKADFENLPAATAELEALRVALPASADYTGLLEQLNTISRDNSVALTSFVPSTPAVVDPSAEGGGEAAPAAPTEAAAALADGTLIAIPVALSATGSYADLQAFIGDLQQSGRLYVVNGLTLANAEGSFTLSVSGDVFVSIDSSVTAAGDAVSEEAPVQTPAPTPTETAAPTPAP